MKFIVDAMLGSLAKWLRIIGYDTVYMKDTSDQKIIAQAIKENRFILTRDTHFARIKACEGRLLLIKSTKLSEQFKQVVNTLKLNTKDNLGIRCVECNTLIKKVPKKSVISLVPPYVYKTHRSFSKCPKCKRIYWQGTHLKDIKNRIKILLKDR